MEHQSGNQVAAAVRDLIEAVVRDRLPDVKIEDVRVEHIEFNDEDDDVVLHVTVVFDAGGKALDPSKTSGMVRHVRPKLAAIGERHFPLFSFVKKSEAERRTAEVG